MSGGGDDRSLAVKVNGAPLRLARSVATVSDVLAELGYVDQFVAVALNRTCVRRGDFTTTPVQQGDEVEILAPMAGG